CSSPGVITSVYNTWPSPSFLGKINVCTSCGTMPSPARVSKPHAFQPILREVTRPLWLWGDCVADAETSPDATSVPPYSQPSRTLRAAKAVAAEGGGHP